jgi:hypothetical protein
MNTKKILVGCFIVLLTILTLGVIGGFLAYRHFISPLINMDFQLEMPKQLGAPAVVTGSEFFSKKLFLEDARLGTVTDILAGKGGSTAEITIAGSKGVLFADKNSNVKSSVMFSSRTSHVDIIDVGADGIYEFMNRGSWGCDASVIDHNGNAIWTYGGLPGVDDMCSGDVDGDGKLEFVVGFNGGGGVHLLDENGKRKWKQPDGNVWHVELVDTNGDGKPEIVHSNAGGKITVRDHQGKIIRRSAPSPYFSGFSLCKWPTKSDREYALLSEDDTIWVFDFDARVVAQFKAPDCGTLGRARGTPVKIKSEESEYFAVIVEFGRWEKSILYVYSPSGELLYQEILPEACASIAAVPLDKSETETILIGGLGRVWQYKVRDSVNNEQQL